MSQTFENVYFNLSETVKFWETDASDWRKRKENETLTSFHDLWLYQNSWEYSGEWMRRIIQNVKNFHSLYGADDSLTKEQCRDNPWNRFLPTGESKYFSPEYIKEHGYVVFAAGKRNRGQPSKMYDFQFLDINESAARAEQRISIAFDFCFARAAPIKLLSQAYWAQSKSYHEQEKKRLIFTIADNTLTIE